MLETTCVIGFATVDMFETVEVEVVDAPSEVSFSTSIDDAATGFMALPIAGAGAEIVGYVASVGGAEDDMVQENFNVVAWRAKVVIFVWLCQNRIL